MSDKPRKLVWSAQHKYGTTFHFASCGPLFFEKEDRAALRVWVPLKEVKSSEKRGAWKRQAEELVDAIVAARLAADPAPSEKSEQQEP